MSLAHVHLSAIFVCTFSCGTALTAGVNMFSLPTQCYVYRQVGDLTLGGMFTIARSSEFSCDFNDDEISLGMLLPEAMAFAISEINKRGDLLPNISLGFEIWDSGWKEDIAVGVALSFVNDSSCDSSKWQAMAGKVIGIVGPGSSATSVIVSKITQSYMLPLVSHWATSNELSNKARFPFFLRTVPPDQLQAGAIVDLLLHFNWHYIAVIYSIDSYGIHGARQLITQAEEGGVCIAMSAHLSELDTDRDLEDIVLALRRLSSVRVVVVFAAGALPYKFLKQLSKTAFPYRITWIASDGWGYSLSDYDQEEIVNGGIFIRLNNPKQPAFEKYLNSIDPRKNNAAGPWFTRYWRTKLSPNCSELDPMETCANPLPDGFSAEYNIAGPIDAVNIFAHGLHSLLMETCPSAESLSNCSFTQAEIDGDDFRRHLLQVSFIGATGPLHLNQNGDPEGVYILKNLQYDEGLYRFVDIGTWDSRKDVNRLQLDVQRIRWSGVMASSTGLPRSLCRETCSAGYIVVPLEQKCCWGCHRCDDNAIVVNGNVCVACPQTHWPNDAFEACIPIVPTTVNLTDPLISSIFVLTCAGILLSCLTTAGMVYYRQNRLVKATSRELSSINLLGLTTAFIAVIPLLQPPSILTCAMSEALISICFTMTYAPTLLKVNRIYRIFRAGKRTVRPPRFVGPGHLIAMAVVLIMVQLVAAVLVGFLDPARPAILYSAPPSDHIELYCIFSTAFPGFCAYNLLIVLLCCYFALRARKVPGNYNESKFIGASVYSSLVLLLAAVPVYTTAVEAKQKIAVLSTAVIANSFITLFFVYFPKLFAVRFRSTTQVEASDTVNAAGSITRSTIAANRPGLSSVVF